jgi:signal peptide peptidase SppA
MKKHLRRRLKACVHQMFAGNEAWALHEPAMAGLLGIVQSPDVDEYQLASAVGMDVLDTAAAMGSGDSAGPQMVGTVMIGTVAVLPIFGVLTQRANWLTRAMGWTSTDTLERDFNAAVANSQVSAIVLLVDSPGGMAQGNEEVSQQIFDARGKKPIFAFVRGMAASAAYYLASAASQMYASASSPVGSIGAVVTHVEYSKALENQGIGVNVVRSAPHKQLWNPYEKLAGDAKTTLQKFVSDFGNQFEQAVARHRGVSQADVKAKFGQGDIFLAAEAASRGLIDGVATWEQMLAKVSASSPAAAVRNEQPIVASIATNESQASGKSAAVSAAVSSPQPPARAAEVSTVKVSARVRAALFARNFIPTQEADDAQCLLVIGAFFAARGETTPQADGALDDAKVINALMAPPPATATATLVSAPLAGLGQGTQISAQGAAAPAANVAAAHTREMAEAAAATKADPNRAKNIRAAGKMLNMSAEVIDAAIDSGKPHAEIVSAWHLELAGKEKPVAANTSVTVTGDGHTRFVADACLAVQHKLDRVGKAEQSLVTDSVKHLSNAPLAYFARQCLAAQGANVPDFISNEELMEIAFAMDGNNRVTVGANSYSPYNRPGSFPNLLSNVANKILDSVLELNEPTYEEWTGEWKGDLPDFKPAPVVAKGQHDELDEILDAEASKEFGLDEEMLSYMILKRFSNKFVLTPVMAANDDLNAFDEGLLGLENAWQNTVNRACLRLLTGNVSLLDGNQLYDNTNHGNDIAGGQGGGPPTDAQWDAMNLKVAAQKGIGGKGRIRTLLEVMLCAPKVFRQATQEFAMFQVIGESKVATQNSNVNIYRGRVTVVREPELQDFSNDVYYGFARPRGMYNATIIRAYFKGWGKTGRRQRWYDPDTKCWNFELEGRVGTAAKQYRLTVRNNGVN